MDAFETDRRRSGGAGWILDESGEWVPTSAEPEAPQQVAAPPVAVPQIPQAGGRARGVLRAIMTVVILPGVAAAGVLYMWKGPGGEIVLSQIEPLVAAMLELRDPDPLPMEKAAPAAEVEAAARPVAQTQARPMTERAPAFQAQALPSLPECASVRRGMADGIVFHRAGGCPD